MICNTVSDWLDCDSDCMGVWDWLAPSSSKPLVIIVANFGCVNLSWPGIPAQGVRCGAKSLFGQFLILIFRHHNKIFVLLKSINEAVVRKI